MWNAGTALQLNVPSNYIAAYNNALIGNINQDFAWVFKEDTWGGRIVNNLVVGEHRPQAGDHCLRRQSEGRRPGFTNAVAHEYALKADSPAIDVAEAIRA